MMTAQCLWQQRYQLIKAELAELASRRKQLQALGKDLAWIDEKIIEWQQQALKAHALAKPNCGLKPSRQACCCAETC